MLMQPFLMQTETEIIDLYIVRGGNEVSSGNPLLDDRLLINDGKGIQRV